MTEQKTDRSKSIVKNVLYGFSTWLFPLGLSFVATPIIVRALGPEEYGIYAFVLGFIAYSFNFNVGRAVTKYIAEYRANGETEKIREVVSATLFVNLIVGLAGLSVILVFSKYLVIDVLKITAESQERTVWALYLSGFTIFCLIFSQVFIAVLQGLHRFDIFAKITNLNNILLIAGNLILALTGYGLLALLSWNLAITAMTAIISAVVALRILPEISFNLKFSRESLKLVFRYSSSVIAYQILANILLLFERIWITGKLGADNLTYYIVPLMLAIYIHGFIGSLMLVIFPLASELKNDRETLLRLYQKATKIVGFLTVFMGTTLIVERKVFLNVWIGADFAAKSADLLILHTLTFCLLAIGIVAWQMTEGLGFPNYNLYLFMVCFIVSIFGMVLLLPDFGSFGVAFARTIGFGMLFISIFYIEKRFFSAVQIKFWLRLAGILAVSTILTIFAENYLITNLSQSWLTIILAGGVGGVVYCLTAWLLGFVTVEEMALLKRLTSR